MRIHEPDGGTRELPLRQTITEIQERDRGHAP